MTKSLGIRKPVPVVGECGYDVSLTSTNPTVLKVFFDDVRGGWEQWVLLLSDMHLDNRDTNRKLIKKHLEQADERGAIKLSIGDAFCAMQGKLDKRSDLREVPAELAAKLMESNAYADSLVEYNAEFLQPHLDDFLLFSDGNHETSFQGRNATNLSDQLCRHLKTKAGTTGAPYRGTYWGWVWFTFRRGNERSSIRLLYFHGSGGGAPVTKGIIDANRWWVMVDNADIIAMGHNHRKMEVPESRMYLDHNGIPKTRRAKFLRLGGYTEHFMQGQGWEAERGMGVKPLGAYWLRLYCESASSGVEFDVIEAH